MHPGGRDGAARDGTGQPSGRAAAAGPGGRGSGALRSMPPPPLGNVKGGVQEERASPGKHRNGQSCYEDGNGSGRLGHRRATPVVIEAQASLFLSSAPRTRHGAGSCRRATSSRAGATGEGARGKPSPGKPGAWKPRRRRVPVKPAPKTGGIAANCGKEIRAGTRLSGRGTGEGRL